MTRAAIYVSPNEPVAVETIELAPPGPHDVVVAITAAGICHSDLSVAQGRYGALFPGNTVLGHEGTGTVLEVGAGVTRMRPGDLVVGTANPTCGACWYCLDGATYLCELTGPGSIARGRRHGGAPVTTMAGLGTFAGTMVCREASLIAVRSDLPAEQLALIGCGVATGVGAALNTAGVRPGQSVAVIGCGGVGQLVVQGARIAGAARIIAIDPVEFKRTTACALGATDAIDPAQGDPVEQLQELTGGRGVDFAFEVVGSTATIVQACQMARRGGTAVVVSSVRADDELRIPNFLEFRSQGKQLLSSVYGSTRSRRDFQRYIDLAEAGRLDLGAMVSATIALDDVNDAFGALDRGEVIRSIITRF